ncbi:(2Fe-2S)-binding protein, partial [bacterium]|nr:(2Fe-2S)-binding protein [candidate division CSSED10-310 bacterium]
MITIAIDGKETKVEPGTTLLAAAKALGITIPTLCHHDMVKPYGACRVCITEVRTNGRSRMVTACNYPVQHPLEAFTNSERVNKERRGILTMLLSRWPEVPIIKQMAKFYKAPPPAFNHPQRSNHPNACILCGLCVRACSEVAREDIITFVGRGSKREVDMPFNEQYERCIGCGTCAHVCPTGAIQLEEDPNHPVDSERIRKFGMRVNEEVANLDIKQNRMQKVGTTTLVEIMDAYDLLPTHNYRFGGHAEAHKIASWVWSDNYFQ